MPERKRGLRRGCERPASTGGIAPPTSVSDRSGGGASTASGTGTQGSEAKAATPGSGQRHRPTDGAVWPGPGGLGGTLK